MSTSRILALRGTFPLPLTRERLIGACVSTITVLLVACPLLPIVYQSFLTGPIYGGAHDFTLANYERFLASPVVHEALLNSLILAVAGTALALLIGLAAAILVARTDMPGRAVLASTMLLPMYVPHLVLAFGWLVLYGPAGYLSVLVRNWSGTIPWNLYSLTGMSVIAGVVTAPVVYLVCLGSLRLLDSSLEGAARSVGARPWTIITQIIVPMLRPAIIYSSMMVFVSNLEILSVPYVFGLPARKMFFTTFLYTAGASTSRPDYGLVGAAAVFLLLLVSVLLFLQGRFLKKLSRYTSVRGKASRPLPFDIGGWRWLAAAAMAVFIAIAVLLPILGVITRSVVEFLTPLLAPWELLSADFYKLLFEVDTYRRSIGNSIVVAGVGALLATAFVSVVAVVVHRSDLPWRRQLEFVATYPRGVPGMVAGLGWFWAVLWAPGLVGLHGTVWIVMIAFTMRALPSALGALSPVLLQIDHDLDRSARSVGADWWTTAVRIILPLAKHGVFAAYVLLVISFFKEYAAAAFLYSHGSEIIGTTMLSMLSSGNIGSMAALATVQLLFIAVFVLLARRVLGVKLYD